MFEDTLYINDKLNVINNKLNIMIKCQCVHDLVYSVVYAMLTVSFILRNNASCLHIFKCTWLKLVHLFKYCDNKMHYKNIRVFVKCAYLSVLIHFKMLKGNRRNNLMSVWHGITGGSMYNIKTHVFKVCENINSDEVSLKVSLKLDSLKKTFASTVKILLF